MVAVRNLNYFPVGFLLSGLCEARINLMNFFSTATNYADVRPKTGSPRIDWSLLDMLKARFVEPVFGGPALAV